MSKIMMWVGTILLAAVPTFASVAVGTCKPSLPSYPTIQQAVNSVPAGTTIQVCPGQYPEQVVINKNVVVKGINVANHGAAIIVVPNGGLVQNAVSLTSGHAIAAQLLVQAPATSVTLSDLTVDGANNGITDCNLNPMGIYYQNASGAITANSVLNEVVPPANGCQSGLGIFVQSGNAGTSTVSITNNHVENYQKNGITGNEAGTNITVSGNTVIGQGPTSGAAENSIQIGFGGAGSIKGNTVGSDIWAPDNINDPGDAAAGLLVYASSGVPISRNNVNNTQFGIAVVSDPNFGAADGSTVSLNTVSATHIFDGIDVCSNNNFVTSNIVNGSDEAGVHVDDSCTGAATGNSVTKNKINSACAGIMNGPGASGNTETPNTYYNAMTLIMNNATQCTPAPAPVKKGAHPNFRPARP